MPVEIRILDVEWLKRQNYDGFGADDIIINDDIEGGYIAFAYPGLFIGYGESREEAMTMAKIRYRQEKQKFLEANPDASEADLWKHMTRRDNKIHEAHKRFGIGKDQIWSEENVKKTAE